MAAALAWLSSDRGVLVIGLSLALGGLGYLWLDCLRLWIVRRSRRDVVDLASTTVFTAMLLGIALTLHTYDSLPAAVVGGVAAALSFAAVRGVLRLKPKA